MIEEVWKDIPLYEGEYQASNLGRIKSLDRAIVKNNGNIQNRKGKILHQNKDKKGYHFLRLKGKNYRVHRLIYLTFTGDIPDGMQVNHIDENKDNNSVSNLNLMTCKENINYGTGIKRSREKLRKSIIGRNVTTGEEIVYESMEEASKMLNISSGRISEICNKTPVKTKVNNKDYYYVRKSYKGYTFCYF